MRRVQDEMLRAMKPKRDSLLDVVTTRNAGVVSRAESLLEEHFSRANVDASHGIAHARAVLRHAQRALEVERMPLNDSERLSIELAALLHDADDRKYFGAEAATNLFNARKIALESGASDNVTALVSEMIGLVSTSKNKNSRPANLEQREWILIPRLCDRLEATGEIGILRCYQYNRHQGTRPLYTPSTPRVTTEEELKAVATPERFAAYTGDSASFIDHFYDKLVHVSEIETNNEYIRQESLRRKQVLLDFLFEFGRTGKVDEERFID